jgi:hypothetical protein
LQYAFPTITCADSLTQNCDKPIWIHTIISGRPMCFQVQLVVSGGLAGGLRAREFGCRPHMCKRMFRVWCNRYPVATRGTGLLEGLSSCVCNCGRDALPRAPHNRRSASRPAMFSACRARQDDSCTSTPRNRRVSGFVTFLRVRFAWLTRECARCVWIDIDPRSAYTPMKSVYLCYDDGPCISGSRKQ